MSPTYERLAFIKHVGSCNMTVDVVTTTRGVYHSHCQAPGTLSAVPENGSRIRHSK